MCDTHQKAAFISVLMGRRRSTYWNFFSRILNIGIDSSTPNELVKRIKIVNGISFLGGVVLVLISILIFISFYPYQKPNFSLIGDFLFGVPEKKNIARFNLIFIYPIIDFSMGVFSLLILAINRSKKYNLAIFLICFAATVYAAFFLFVGGIKVAFFFFMPAIIPVIFYQKKLHYITFCIFNIAVYFAVFSVLNSNNSLFYTPPYQNYFFTFIINSVAAFAILFLIITHFKNQNIKNEEVLSQKNDILQQLSDEISAQRDELKLKNEKIEQQTRNMISSIVYAEKLQQAILPQSNILNNFFSDSFIFFSPRDIVSGDFYWIKRIDRNVIVAAVDCTGHGVPGALMSMLGISFMNDIASNANSLNAGKILDQLRDKVKTTLNQTSYENFQKDGMEMALCIIGLDNMTMQYAGAHNPLYIIRENLQISEFESIANKNVVEYTGKTLLEVKANKQPVAIGLKEVPFETHEIKIFKGDLIYLFTDGHIDQIGGEDSKKFSAKKFKQLLLGNSHKTMQQQLETINQTFNSWRKGQEQFDDMLIIGIKI